MEKSHWSNTQTIPILIAIGWLGATAIGCTGLTLGENKPGEDVYLESGSIAVSPESETSFVLVKSQPAEPDDGGEEQPLPKTLYSVAPDNGEVKTVADLTGYADLRILFPSNRILLMAEKDGQDELRILDPTTHAEVARETVDASYRGTRLSPSRRFVAVADNAQDRSPIHIIDTTDLKTTAVPHDGEWLEAMWMQERDELVAIVFYDIRGDAPRARILSWSMQEQANLDRVFSGDDQIWPAPDLDITVQETRPDLLFSFTWVGISSDDRYAVFPIQRAISEDEPNNEDVEDASGEDDESGSSGEEEKQWLPQLLVVDTETGELRTVDDAYGPVGFSPDGSTIISYRYVSAPKDEEKLRTAQLLLIDRETLQIEVVDLDELLGGPHYFITDQGNTVVISSNSPEQEGLIFYDLDSDELTTVDGPHVGLDEFISRPAGQELWLVDEGLHRLDLAAGQLETVPLGWRPEHINILPRRDRLVLDAPASQRLIFYDPVDREITREIVLPEAARPGG